MSFFHHQKRKGNEMRQDQLLQELQDPLGMIGKTVPSTCCRGRTATVVGYELATSCFTLGKFIAKCGCGMFEKRERATDNFEEGYRPQPGVPSGMTEETVLAMQRFLATWPVNTVHRTADDPKELFGWGVTIDAEKITEMKPSLLAKLREELSMSLERYQERRHISSTEPMAEVEAFHRRQFGR
jgi:hypothetical protein